MKTSTLVTASCIIVASALIYLYLGSYNAGMDRRDEGHAAIALLSQYLSALDADEAKVHWLGSSISVEFDVEDEDRDADVMRFIESMKLAFPWIDKIVIKSAVEE